MNPILANVSAVMVIITCSLFMLSIIITTIKTLKDIHNDDKSES